ncbi:uncharacterized protein TRIREDRAFT_111632 [Trichoderma reesei QM6a]|uniref:Predicted protein n=1 Tax=Hypocrea jecorina (strain QM6a) TaxID=431241 RepID=G0RV12_HYPJQ|nr:uncharacterized protein TRIREDRAFT_111632 [Trichoderma reesei QM6a]EGR44968.1 predicted protein [Trichoderma reesei QM6a]
MDTSTVIDYLRLISHYIALLGRLLTLPLRLLIWTPLSYLARALRIVFFPVFYLVAYVAGWFRGIVDFITALQPLIHYDVAAIHIRTSFPSSSPSSSSFSSFLPSPIFTSKENNKTRKRRSTLNLATAALVGAFAGLTLATSSTVITSYLGMQGDTSRNGNGKSSSSSRSSSGRSRTPSQGKDPLSSYYSSPNTLVKDDSSSNEGEWYWPDPSPSRRRPATGLLSQTILEEEDDSDV